MDQRKGWGFERNIAPSNTISVHVSESSDEEELEDGGEWEEAGLGIRGWLKGLGF